MDELEGAPERGWIKSQHERMLEGPKKWQVLYGHLPLEARKAIEGQFKSEGAGRLDVDLTKPAYFYGSLWEIGMRVPPLRPYLHLLEPVKEL